MKKILLLTCILYSIAASAQRSFGLVVSANLDFAATGFGTNDAGIGLSLSPSFFAKSRLQLKTAASLDHFVGNKLGYVDATGNVSGYNPTVLSGLLGPYFFVNDHVSFAGLCGVATFEKFGERTTAGAVQLALTAYGGRRKRGVLACSYSALSQTNPAVHFFSLHVGYKIL